MKSIKRISIILILLGLLMMGCRWLVNFYAFYPDREDLVAVDHLPSGVEEVIIPTADGKTLQCYWITRPAAARTLIYFHGNAGNIGHRIPDLLALADMGLNVLGVGYRGYGKSSGKPSEKGIYIDGRAALDHVNRVHNITSQQVILLGRSIGSTVAVDLARQNQVAGLILVTPMTTGKALAKFHHFGILTTLAGDAFDNLNKIVHIRSPLLIVHGTLDNIVPFSMGEQLYAQAPSPKHFADIQGAGHNDISLGNYTRTDPYWDAIRQWVQALPGDG